MGSVARKRQGALGLQHDGSVDHAAVEPGRAGRCSIGSKDALSPVECLRARMQCGEKRRSSGEITLSLIDICLCGERVYVVRRNVENLI